MSCMNLLTAYSWRLPCEETDRPSGCFSNVHELQYFHEQNYHIPIECPNAANYTCILYLAIAISQRLRAEIALSREW
jgi:hypothetical protein